MFSMIFVCHPYFFKILIHTHDRHTSGETIFFLKIGDSAGVQHQLRLRILAGFIAQTARLLQSWKMGLRVYGGDSSIGFTRSRRR